MIKVGGYSSENYCISDNNKKKGQKMARSSINLQLAKLIAFLHNTREAVVSYVIAEAARNSFDKDGKEAYRYYLNLLAEATGNYTKRTKQRVQTDEKKFLWEAVINLNENHTLQDVKLLARILRMRYGWQPVQLSTHGDEGHVDTESGENIYNYHAHIVFFMLDKQGIYRFKKRDFGIKKMEELQTLVSRVLKMERGVSKKKTRKVRLEHNQFRQVQKEKEQRQIEYDNLQKKLNILSLNHAYLKRNKKKTAKVLRNKSKQNFNLKRTNDNLEVLSVTSMMNERKVREFNSILMNYRNFMHRIKELVNQNLENYPLIFSDGLINEDHIIEWINEGQSHILSLVSERDELTKEAYTMMTVYDEFTYDYSEFPVSYKELYEEELKKNDVLKDELNQERTFDKGKPLKGEIKGEHKSSNTNLQKDMGFKSL